MLVDERGGERGGVGVRRRAHGHGVDVVPRQNVQVFACNEQSVAQTPTRTSELSLKSEQQQAFAMLSHEGNVSGREGVQRRKR